MNSSEFRGCFKMILALAVVPINNLKFEIEKLKKYINERESLNEMKDFYCQFIDLYCRYFSDDDNPKNIFSVYFWSIVDRIVNKIPKTNNDLEGWHRSLYNNFQNAHPNIYELGMELKKQLLLSKRKLTNCF
ncbi:hypothetical protein DMUE_2261 [Dictyocoela muelleri]|nr:hypothetical protein DMUE_2261 [Dictyocoela muelleri]